MRNGTIVDGTGAPPFEGDVAVRDGRIVAVGEVGGTGAEEIDARDRIVTPGFVDIHTHFDGHATWAERLEPSSQHGVTTVLTGNCGVGFAPCRPEDRETLVRLMEGVEDIPEVVMTAGLPWTWESFPEYLDLLEGRRFDVDVATQIPHAPLRVFTMGQRAVEREPATEADVAAMRGLVREALVAGALGFSTSRSLNHRASDGTLTFSYGAAADELAGIAAGLRDAGTGVLQIISDFDDVDAEFDIVRRMAGESGRPLSLSLIQMPQAPDRWQSVLARVEQARDDGLEIRPQVCGRPIGVLMALEFSSHPFEQSSSYGEVADLEPARRRAALLDPERRRRVLAEFAAATDDSPRRRRFKAFANMYELDDDPDYEPAAEDSLAARAAREGRAPAELAYDLLVERDGVIYFPAANYSGNSLDAIRQMLAHPAGVLGLGDGGAHCGMICDASLPTYMLSRWVAKDAGPAAGRMPLESVVRSLSAGTASAVGLGDRGELQPGMRADLNVIDVDRLRLHRPEAVADLPNGETRLGQRADGFDATVVAGVTTRRGGEATGALPGRLVRGAQRRPDRPLP